MKEKKAVTMQTLIKRRIIFIIIFLIICTGITTYFIVANPLKKHHETVTPKEDLDTEIAKRPDRTQKSLLDYENDTFNQNELKISEKVLESDENYDITYFQIDGLKNTTIQDKINKNLENDLKDAIEENRNNGNIKENLNVWSYNASNFANTLSIIYTVSSYTLDDYGNELYNWNDYILENYDLNTGEKIKIQDLFTDDTLGVDIFDSYFYQEFVKNHTDQDFDDTTGIAVITDYNDIEEAIFKLITDFNNGKDIPFYFDEQSVTLLENYSTIYFEDHLDFVAVYNNFKSSNSLFTGEYFALKGLPVLTKKYPAYYEVIEEGENYYIDFTLDGFNYSYDEETKYRLLEAAKLRMEEEIKNMKQEAKESGKFIIYNYAYNVDEHFSWDYYSNSNKPDGTYVINITKAKMETTKSLFKSELKPKIQELFRKSQRLESGEIEFYNNIFYYYLIDNDEDSEKWETNYDEELYMDKVRKYF